MHEPSPLSLNRLDIVSSSGNTCQLSIAGDPGSVLTFEFLEIRVAAHWAHYVSERLAGRACPKVPQVIGTRSTPSPSTQSLLLLLSSSESLSFIWLSFGFICSVNVAFSVGRLMVVLVAVIIVCENLEPVTHCNWCLVFNVNEFVPSTCSCLELTAFLPCLVVCKFYDVDVKCLASSFVFYGLSVFFLAKSSVLHHHGHVSQVSVSVSIVVPV